MSDKNNIEDFFSNSMDGFRGAPSDEVWQRLSSQMDEEKPFWNNPLFWWLSLATLLLLIAFGIYRNNILAEVDLLMEQKNILETEKLTLETELKNCSTAITENKATDSEIKDLSEFDANKTSKESLVSNNPVSSGRNKKVSGKTEMDYYPKSNTSNAIQERVTVFLDGRKIEEQLKNTNGGTGKGVTESEEKLTNSIKINKRNTTGLFRTLVKLPLLNTTVSTKGNSANKRIAKLKDELIERMLWQQKMELKEAKSSYKPSLRYGISLGAFTTFTDLHSEKKPGYDAAFSLQLQLFKKLALTSDFGFNMQEYKKTFRSSDQVLANTFPHSKLIDLPISEISVTNLYFDIPVGLKWNFGNWSDSGKSVFINPGVAWQLLLPQYFDYKTTSGEVQEFFDKRYFLYFGSVFMNAGIEQRLREKIHWQFGLWAEKGLVHYGLEDRSMFNLGLRGAILFGR